MGFLKNMFNEAGTKTGKAIGNKLFGSYANDLNIGISGSQDVSAKDEVQATMKIEMVRARHEKELQELQYAQQRDKEQRARELQIEDEIMNIEFGNDKDDTIAKLAKLLSILKSNSNTNYKTVNILELAKTKFDIGLALLRSMDPGNSMIPFFDDQINDYQKDQKNKKIKSKKEMVTVFTMIGGFMAFTLALGLGTDHHTIRESGYVPAIACLIAGVIILIVGFFINKHLNSRVEK